MPFAFWKSADTAGSSAGSIQCGRADLSTLILFQLTGRGKGHSDFRIAFYLRFYRYLAAVYRYDFHRQAEADTLSRILARVACPVERVKMCCISSSGIPIP